jgi:5-methylcytosine-specific restriction endonuclease McrA
MVTRPSRPRSSTAIKAVKAYKEACIQQGPQFCYFCGEGIDMDLHYRHTQSFTVQHITPVSRGGTDDPENFAPAHRSCNSREGARLAGTKGTDIPYADIGPHLKQSRVW